MLVGMIVTVPVGVTACGTGPLAGPVPVMMRGTLSSAVSGPLSSTVRVSVRVTVTYTVHMMLVVAVAGFGMGSEGSLVRVRVLGGV